MYLVKIRFPHSYDERTDSFGNMHVPDQFGALVYLAIPCFVLAVLFHPGKEGGREEGREGGGV